MSATPTDIPYTLERNDRGFLARCKFCESVSVQSHLPGIVRNSIIHHARVHLNPNTGLYMCDEDLQIEKKRRTEYRARMGNSDEVNAANDYEKEMGL